MDPKWIAAIVIGVVILLGLPLLASSKVTMDNYNEVKIGMTYEQVKDILGTGKTPDEVDPPKLKQSDLPPGMPMPDEAQMKRMQDQAMKQMKAMGIEVYIWQRGDEKAITVMIQDGKVAGKTQTGLADQPSADFGDGGMPGMPGPGGPPPGMPMPGMPPMGGR